MPTPMRPWTIRLLELIEGGVSHREDLIRGASPFVPVGHAYRVREQFRMKAAQKFRRRYPDAPELTRAPRSTTEIHRVGARLVLDSCLHSLVANGRLIREGDHYRLHRPVESTSAMHSADEAQS